MSLQKIFRLKKSYQIYLQILELTITKVKYIYICTNIRINQLLKVHGHFYYQTVTVVVFLVPGTVVSRSAVFSRSSSRESMAEPNSSSSGRYHDMSNEKNLGCLGYMGDYTTQLYRDYNKPL